MASNLPPKSDSSDSTKQRGPNNPRSRRSDDSGVDNVRSRSSSRVSVKDSAQLTSVRIGDIDLDRRGGTQKKKSVRWPYIVVGCIAAVILIFAIALIVVSRTSILEIEDVSIEGIEHLTEDEVTALVSIPVGTTMFDVDEDSIKASLMRDAWIKDVKITRDLPSTLKITVTERQIVAIVEIPVESGQDMQSWAISADGMWLMAVPAQDSEIGQGISAQIYEDAADALWITDVPYGVTPAIGVYCTDENINNALAIVSGMTTELKDQVKTVSATDAESTLLTLDSGIEIAFGVAENIRDKERICLEIMKENPTVVYINVRVVDRPTWRMA